MTFSFFHRQRRGAPRVADLATMLRAVPVRTPTVCRTVDGNGDRLTVVCRRPHPGWHRFLSRGGTSHSEKAFELDACGRDVFLACDGRRNLGTIVAEFARTHKVTLAESQTAVMAFAKTLVQKGLIELRRDSGA